SLLDPGPAANARNLWMGHSGVLVNLAEQVLAVNQLERPTAQAPEGEAKPRELVGLRIGHEPDHFGLDASGGRAEALADSVARPRTRHDELHLAEPEPGRIVQ